MADSSSSGSSGPGLGDLLGLLGGSNPFAGLGKSIAQFQRGVGQFLDSVEKFNDTMDQLNGVATRLNGLLDTVEEPVRAFVPQVTRTIRTADVVVEQLSATVGELAQRLQPLAQLADTAGGWFGLRPLAALRGGSASPATPPATPAEATAPVKKAPVKKAPVKKAPVKKAPVKKAPVKKAPVKKAPVKKAIARPR